MGLKAKLYASTIAQGGSAAVAAYGYMKGIGTYISNLSHKIITDATNNANSVIDNLNNVVDNADKVADKLQDISIYVNQTMDVNQTISDLFEDFIPVGSSVSNVPSAYNVIENLTDKLNTTEGYFVMGALFTIIFIGSRRASKRLENAIEREENKKYNRMIEKEIQDSLKNDNK